jgi:hypothetical protein
MATLTSIGFAAVLFAVVYGLGAMLFRRSHTPH